MSDPLSIAGTAVGIVLLGLTTCSGLIEYVDGVRCRKDDIETTLRHINCLRDTFLNIESAISKLSRDHSVATGAAEKCLRLSEKGLHRLQLVLKELKKEALPSDNLNSKVAAQARKLSYPFRRANLRRLEVNVNDLNGTLQIILQAIELDVNGSQLDRLAQLVENSNATSNQITTLLEGVATANQSLTLQNLNLGLLNLHLRHISEAQHQQVLSIQSIDQRIKNLQMQLVSKPDALRNVYYSIDELRALDPTRHQGRIRGDWSPSISRSVKRSTMPCSCFEQYYFQNNYYTASRLSFSYSNENLKQHLPGCHSYALPQKSHKVKARFTYLGYVLSASIQASISITTGAGGFSISPSLSISRVVPSDAYAFELLSFENFGKYIKSSKETVARRHHLLEYAREQLLKLFNERRAFPKDINENGKSLIHVILGNFWVDQVEEPMLLYSFCKLLTTLSTCGVPVDIVDSYGFSPLHLCTEKIPEIDRGEASRLAVITIIKTLIDCGANCTINPTLLAKWVELDSGLKHVLVFQQHIDLAEAFQCGPLSIAILQRSETEVRRILASQPQCLAERNLLRQTPLHLSCDWPLGVKLILEAGGYNIIDSTDFSDSPAFLYACEKCCPAVLDLLLAADCCLFITDTVESFGNNMENFTCALRDGNFLTIASLTSCLKERRNRLKALALEMLPIKSIHDFLETSGTILDSKATDICAALKAHGIAIPLSLTIPINKDTIYHLPYLSIKTAKILYDLGFRDLDIMNDTGLTPLMSSTIHSYRDSEEILAFSSWLLSQGASLNAKSEVPQGYCLSNKTAAHFLAGPAGCLIREGRLHLRGAYGKINPDINRLISEILLVSERDDCFCSCSTGGCRPVTLMLKPALPLKRNHDGQIDSILIADWIGENMTTNQAQDWLSREILRFMTFDKLGIKHTCCEIGSDGRVTWQKLQEIDEIREIREEYAYLLDLLEVLIQEFEIKYVELRLRIAEFLEGYWTERMREVIAELDSVNPEELQRITELGVVLEKTEQWPSDKETP